MCGSFGRNLCGMIELRIRSELYHQCCCSLLVVRCGAPLRSLCCQMCVSYAYTLSCCCVRGSRGVSRCAASKCCVYPSAGGLHASRCLPGGGMCWKTCCMGLLWLNIRLRDLAPRCRLHLLWGGCRHAFGLFLRGFAKPETQTCPMQSNGA